MAVCYNRLWKLLIDRRMTKTQLCKEAGVTTNAIAKMGRDESVQVETLVKICTALSGARKKQKNIPCALNVRQGLAWY